ncbi:type II toxin-antitoxin system MqsA family antitoxin [Salicibibacter halophilus]|uniref:Type II toxin-antitoxin system MqsA family antitoxin n=1 Tax=Salicibibacter halophilus TaxID=2502791 RepID=A0A514LIA5_9BACI|nr:type II toxin-antitoxin system MqsA family antitoxin [Salicibibacter halophilus]QDI91588.1 type II toxin-antitoxin system MqsA family antitoxin [Salicibibacter halophilus]
MKKCFLCKGDLTHQRVSVERKWNDKKIIIEDVPAEVCEQCGEHYFDGETTLKLEKIKKAGVFPQEQLVNIPASVRDFKNISYMEKEQ